MKKLIFISFLLVFFFVIGFVHKSYAQGLPLPPGCVTCISSLATCPSGTKPPATTTTCFIGGYAASPGVCCVSSTAVDDCTQSTEPKQLCVTSLNCDAYGGEKGVGTCAITNQICCKDKISKCGASNGTCDPNFFNPCCDEDFKCVQEAEDSEFKCIPKTEANCNIVGGCSSEGVYKLKCDTGGCETAVGRIGLSRTAFVKSVFSVMLTLVGALAVLLIILSGYKIIMARGNPEKIKDGQEQLTAAIIGLLFVIFSIVFLEVIGVEILGINFKL